MLWCQAGTELMEIDGDYRAYYLAQYERRLVEALSGLLSIPA